jgi:hypothetical protein
VNAHQSLADSGGCQPSKQKDFGILNASIENGFASVDIGLRFGLGDQIAAVPNQDESSPAKGRASGWRYTASRAVTPSRPTVPFAR